MSAPGVCPVDGCEWMIPTARLYPGPSVKVGESVLRRGWLRDEDAMIEDEVAYHYRGHTTIEWLNTIIRLQDEVNGGE